MTVSIQRHSHLRSMLVVGQPVSANIGDGGSVVWTWGRARSILDEEFVAACLGNSRSRTVCSLECAGARLTKAELSARAPAKRVATLAARCRSSSICSRSAGCEGGSGL